MDYASDRYVDYLRLAQDETSTSETLAKIAKIPGFQSLVARNPNASSELLEDLSLSIDPWVRYLVAIHNSTLEATLENLSKDSEISVRVAIAENQRTPASALKNLALDEEDSVRETVAGNPHSPISTRELLAKDNNPLISFIATLPTKFLETENLYADILARNDTPKKVLNEVLLDNEAESILDAVENPSLSQSTMLHICFDEEIGLFTNEWESSWQNMFLAAIARHQNVPTGLLALLNSYTSALDCTEAIAKNPKTPIKIIEELSLDEREDIRGAIALNPSTPEKTLSTLREDEHWYVQKCLKDRK